MNQDLLIHYDDTIISALKALEKTQQKALICINNKNELKGIVVDGDIRRGLIAGIALNDSIKKVMNSNPITLNESANTEDINSLLSNRITILPIVSSNNILVDYHILNQKDTYRNIKKKNITILGMGYVGLTLGLILADCGFNIIGLDINEELINQLNEQKEPFYEEGLNFYLNSHVGSSIKFTTDDENSLADVYIITVGTPLQGDSKQPNLNYIQNAASSIGKILKKGDLVILRSTVQIGTSREIVIPMLEQISNLSCGEDFFVSFAPERTAEGVALTELRKNPQIIGSFDEKSYELTSRIFEVLTPTVINVNTLEAAELCKLIDNTYRDHIFSYANNIAKVSEKLGLNIHKLINAVNFGYLRNHVPKPSPGVGGPCLSKDPYILSQTFKKYDINTDLIMNVRQVNENGPKLIKEKLIKLLDKNNKTLKDSKVSLIGMAFKGYPETSDLRDSTSLWFLNEIQECTNINLYDATIDDNDLKKLGHTVVSLGNAFKNSDAVIILNNHRSYQSWNLEHLLKTMNTSAVFIDTWYNFNPIFIKKHHNILYGGLGND